MQQTKRTSPAKTATARGDGKADSQAHNAVELCCFLRPTCRGRCPAAASLRRSPSPGWKSLPPDGSPSLGAKINLDRSKIASRPSRTNQRKIRGPGFLVLVFHHSTVIYHHLRHCLPAGGRLQKHTRNSSSQMRHSCRYARTCAQQWVRRLISLPSSSDSLHRPQTHTQP